MIATIRYPSAALAVLAAAGACQGGPQDGLVARVEIAGEGAVRLTNAPGEKPFGERCAWDDEEACVISSGAPVVATAEPAPGWRFVAWEDAASGNEAGELGYSRCAGSSPSRTLGVHEGDFPFRFYCRAVFVEEDPGTPTGWPVEVTWDEGGRVEVGGDATETSAEGTQWTGAVPEGGRLELRARVVDPEMGDLVFRGWRADAGCPVSDPAEPEAVIPMVREEIACHADFGPAENPCGSIDPSAVEVSFTIDGIPWDALPAEGDPPVYDPADPTDIALAATVSGVAPRQLVYAWAIKPYHAERMTPWIDLQSCEITAPTCRWDGTALRWEDTPVSVGLLRLTVRGCAGEVDETVGPAHDGSGTPVFVDLYP
jgi:hypothetical protein